MQRVLDTAGPYAERIADLWWLMLIVCGGVFLAVLAALGVALWRAPRATYQTLPDLSPTVRIERAAQVSVVVALAISGFLLLVLLVASLVTDRALARVPAENPLRIQVTANQWWWHLRYDDPVPARTFTTANELHIPAGRTVELTLKSNDVIHSLWIPNLAGKKDLIPGRSATLHIRAEQPGTYRAQCAEFCGHQHAKMALLVVAHPPQDYEAWAEAQRQPAPEPADEAARRGRELFVGGRCATCHAILGTPANGRLGPDLTHLASRQTLAAGTLPNKTGHLAGWIVDPHSAKPGVRMPANPMPADELHALLAYLGTLK